MNSSLAQSAGAAEYTNCIYVQGQDFPNECPVYDTKQSDGEAPVMLELWGIQCTPLLPSLPCPLCSRVVAPDWVLSIGQIELNRVWNEPPQALAFMSMHTKLNICAIIKQATFPH